MYITNITDDNNDTLSVNNNCTNNDDNIQIIIPLFYNHTMRNVTYLFNISDDICFN